MLNQPAQQQNPTDPTELASFLDGFFAEEMAEHHVPGAAIVFRREGEILLARGYGCADTILALATLAFVWWLESAAPAAAATHR